MEFDVNLMSRLLKSFTVEYESCDSALWPDSIRANFGLVLTHMDLPGSVDTNKDTCVKETNKMHFSILIYSDNLSSTCFEQSKYSLSGGS